MDVTHERILDELEGISFLTAPHADDVAVHIPIDDVCGIRSVKYSFADVNNVGRARFTAENVFAKVEEVKAYYNEYRHDFVWMVSDRSTPENLGDDLLEAGFELLTPLTGLALADLNHTIQVNQAVTIREATQADYQHVHRLYRDAFGLNDDDVTRAVLLYDAGQRMQHYLAWIDVENGPVGIASMFYSERAPIAVLQGAATADTYRGRGVYSALMAHRLDEARQAGMKLAILQAVAATSAPIARKMGFKKLLDMSLYVYKHTDK